MSIYNLSVQEFTELLESGVLYKLYPEYKGVLFNAQQFEHMKEQYEVENALYNFFFDIIEHTGVDPAEFYDLFMEHKDNILLFLQSDVDASKVLAQLMEGE